MTRHPVALVIAVALSAAAVSGCGTTPGTFSGRTPAASTSPPATLSPSPTSGSPSTQANAAPPPLDGVGPDEGDASPTPPDASSAQQAQTRAGAFMRAFARTDLPQQQWWDGLAGYFTPAARAVYQSTDVANVPVHKVVEGSAHLRAGATKFRAEVTVDTDAGTYTVTMIRAGGTWLVDRATPPKQ